MKAQIMTQSRLLLTAIAVCAFGVGGCGAVDPTTSESEPTNDVGTSEGAVTARAPACPNDGLEATAVTGSADRTLTPPKCCVSFTITVKNKTGATCSRGGSWRLLKNHSVARTGSFFARDFIAPTDFHLVPLDVLIQKPFDVEVTIGGAAKKTFNL